MNRRDWLMSHWTGSDTNKNMSIAKLEFALKLQQNKTSQEKKFYEFVKNKENVQGETFKSSQPMFGYIVDFVCNSLKFIVEIDGPYHYQRYKEDAFRDSIFEKNHWVVFRFSNEQIENNFDDVVGLINLFIKNKRQNEIYKEKYWLEYNQKLLIIKKL
jgi:very-short-patch-repair endonuclease